MKLQAINKDLKIMIENNNNLEEHALKKNLQGVNEITKPGLIERVVKLSEVIL